MEDCLDPLSALPSRPHILFSIIVTFLFVSFACAQDTAFAPKWNRSQARIARDSGVGRGVAPATCDPEEIHGWLRTYRTGVRSVVCARVTTMRNIGDRTGVDAVELCAAQMMVHDRYFYDPAKGSYTIGRYLDDVDKRYGGIDSVLVWHTYSNIGIDSRSQYDMFRDLPAELWA